MADMINAGLRQEALNQAVAKLRRESKPVSDLARPVVEQMERETAEQMFASSWHTAKQMQIQQNKHVAGRKPVEAPLPKPIDGLPPEIQARMEASRRKMAEMAQNSNASMYEAFDRKHEEMMLSFFTRLGITAATVEKVVAAVKEAALHG